MASLQLKIIPDETNIQMIDELHKDTQTNKDLKTHEFIMLHHSMHMNRNAYGMYRLFPHSTFQHCNVVDINQIALQKV